MVHRSANQKFSNNLNILCEQKKYHSKQKYFMDES